MNLPRTKRPLRMFLALVLFVAIGAAACSDDQGTKVDPNARTIEIYSTTIESVAAHMGASTEKTDKPLLIFVNNLSDNSLSAEVQLGVVLALEDWASIRFIDDLQEAIDTAAPMSPPKNEGMLIGLGNIGAGETTTRVYADSYVSDQETWVFDVSLVLRGGEWQLEAPLQPTMVVGASH
ncbi:MAG: hypothetical protein WDA77_08625 [Acidimicrobiia bacterium]